MYILFNQISYADPTNEDYGTVSFLLSFLKFVHIAAFVKDSGTAIPYYVLFYLIVCIKAVVYLFIILNILKSHQKQDSHSTWSDSILRFLYGFNFHLFFIPVTDTLSSIFKCFGPQNLIPGQNYALCASNKNAYLVVSVVILIIKILINISHEVCDTEKKIKYAKPWSK